MKEIHPLIAYHIHIKGLVQGVGFRPYIYLLANKLHLSGWIMNSNDGVKIRIQGKSISVNTFIDQLPKSAPTASVIETIEYFETIKDNSSNFYIIKSKDDSDEVTEISPDICVCDNCLNDMKKQNHRIDYPFINCTNCGPRFTIIKGLPYDRHKTTMSEFTMCPICNNEYQEITDRRFHAQPIACNHCGPSYNLNTGQEAFLNINTIINKVSLSIHKGKIVIIKGLGGYNIACDAFNISVVKRLRKLKNRDAKPFAVMFHNIETLRDYAIITKIEEKSLLSWRRPIVLLKQKKSIAVGINSDLNTIGVMLPYLPIHHLLFRKLKTPAIVLTSGNLGEEPIIINDKIAKKKLSIFSNEILSNNREIYNRTDDSVVFIANNKERLIRRSRGYVPASININLNAEGILALGGELKNCFCIGKGNKAILSQHIGDLKNVETYDFYNETIERFKKIFRFKPKMIVNDLHPDYLSTSYASEIDLPSISVQHHYAHIASCMAEYQLDEKVIGVSFDGTGYGDDGNIWGSEFFTCDLNEYNRFTHFDYLPLPGGDKAMGSPWRTTISWLHKVYGNDFTSLGLPLFDKIPHSELEKVILSLEKQINCPLSSGAGRFFDAVSVLLSLCLNSSFEAEAPMKLESIIDNNIQQKYGYEISDKIVLDDTLHSILNDIKKGISPSVISSKFHNTIISIICDVVNKMSKETGIKNIVLSGGVFQNRFIITKIENHLSKLKYEVYSNTRVPANDGGIALGQLLIAAKRRK